MRARIRQSIETRRTARPSGVLAAPNLPPSSEQDLLARARALAGRTVSELATALAQRLPTSALRSKGTVGTLVDRFLVGSQRAGRGPDLPSLGIEIKSLPIDARGMPAESTFVCLAQLDELPDLEWEASLVREKLGRVLFVPVETQGTLATRRIGSGFLWSPTAEQELALRADYAELAAEVALGDQGRLVAQLGACLQLRPKGPNAQALASARDERGAKVRAMPRGFYLRRSFTTAILDANR